MTHNEATAALAWRSISTMPNDNTFILAATDDDRPAMVYRASSLARNLAGPTPEHLRYPATKWMPIPKDVPHGKVNCPICQGDGWVDSAKPACGPPRWLDEPVEQVAMGAQALAVLFHDTYERLAPSFGYETRQETRAFDPESANGKLMIAVCAEIATKPADARKFRGVGELERTGYIPDGSSDERDAMRAEIERLNAIVNAPQSGDFIRAVSTEAEHQRQRWGSSHDAGKMPADWFWLIGYLAGKVLHAHTAGDTPKAEHHIITTAAACANWHRAMLGRTDMRPGIDGEAALRPDEQEDSDRADPP